MAMNHDATGPPPTASEPEGGPAAGREGAGDDRRVRDALDANFLRQFRHLMTGFIVLAGWMSIAEGYKAAQGEPHLLLSLLPTLVSFVLIRLALTRWSPAKAWVHPLGVLIVLAITANGLYFVLIQEVAPSAVPLAFVLVVTGSLFLSVRWYALTTAVVVTVWTTVVLPRIPEGRVDEYGLSIFMFLFLSALLFSYRVRTQTNLARLQLRDERQRRELTLALKAAHEQIGERERSEQALRESEARYRHVVDRSPVAILLHDTKRVVFANREAARLVGLEEPEDMLGRPIDTMIHSESVEFLKQRATFLMSTGQPTPPADIRVIGVDGRVREVEVTAQLVSMDGAPMVQAVMQNVTERRKAERALRQSEERYRLLADNVTDGIWTADLDLRFTYFSPSIEKIFGVPVDVALGIPVERMMAPDSLRLARRALEEQVELARRNGPGDAAERTLELQFVAGDGRAVWTEVKSRILFDGEGRPQGVLGVTRDITERRKAQEQLRRSEERYRLLAEHATDVIFTSDLRLNLTFLSPAAARLFGYAPEEVRDLKAEVLLAPASLELVRQSLKAELGREGEAGLDQYRSRTFELEYLTRDGSGVWTEVRVSFIRDGGGAATGLVGVIRDISERRAAEAERQKLEAQLVQAQKLEAIGTLAGGIAHDFNNLLTGILGYAELIKLEAEEGGSIHEGADVIQNAATRARELTGQLLGFARKGKHQNTRVSVNRTIGEVVQLLGRTLAKNIEIVRMTDPADPVILGDPAQLQQVVLNLAINAQDAMPGGGTLTFTTSSGPLDAACRERNPGSPAGRYVAISVGDTGSGIPPEARDRIFEPFFTTKEPGRGTGMGLAMVYGIVKNHGGFIDLATEVGQGTTFTLYFPAVGVPEGDGAESGGLVGYGAASREGAGAPAAGASRSDTE